MNAAPEKKKSSSLPAVPNVQVLLSTFNGQDFLREQLDSILSQDYPHVDLLVRDDGSTDDTWTILQNYASHHSNMSIYRGENLGAAHSFLDLLRCSSPHAEYVAFADQDDVWFTNKLSRAIEQLACCEDTGACLYYSRVTLTDSKLHPLRDSRLPRRGLLFANALVETPVYGCTTVINRQARELLQHNFPNFVSMHDSWFYMVISAFGHILYDAQPSMLLRRHQKNTSDMPVSWLDRIWVQAYRIYHRGASNPRVRQAKEFQRLFHSTLPPEPKRLLENFLTSRHSFLERVRYAFGGEAYHQSVLGNLMLKGLLILDRVHD